MRTQDEIIKRYIERRERDLLGFEVHEYVNALDWENAKQFLKADAEESPRRFTTDDDVRACMADYIDFAYRKCFDKRGISAQRSIMHYVAWIWLLGDDAFLAQVECEHENSKDYGESTLDLIASHYGYPKVACDPAEMPPNNAVLYGIGPKGGT